MKTAIYIIGLLFFASALLLASDATDVSKANKASVIEKFRAPVQKHSNGVVRTLLHAEKASLYPDGAIAAERVVVESYDDKANFVGSLQVSNISFDKTRTKADSDGHVRYERLGLRLEGDGLLWNSESNKISLLSNSKLVIRAGGKSILEELN